MSYLLYTSIARAGGIDLLLSTESFARDHEDHLRAHRRKSRPTRPGRVTRLRRGAGRTLVAVGVRLTAWGRRWSQPAANPALEPVR